ncbi:hypothetical protein [Sphingomonas sp.]|uniref:hypothetical protein n=1 Tax=Sphingomonas sp. TaxID=28214 RepID=UPI0035BC0D35
MLHRSFTVVLLATLSACAGRAPQFAIVPLAPPPIAVLPVVPPMPAGASPGMAIPAMLADGRYATPNAALSPAATVWHLRAGLNVAALACRADEATTVARYNALLAANRTALTTAEAQYAAEFRGAGGDWRDRYDDAMTRLYNYYATSPAQPAFCAAAAQILADAAAVPATGFAAFAAERLPALDRPFTDFYRAYDAWRRGTLPPAVLASAAIASQPPAPVIARVEVDRRALLDDRLASR